MTKYILAIDQGTTSSRAILFDKSAQPVNTASQTFAQHFPHTAWVEHDPEDIWNSVVQTVREVLDAAKITAHDVAALGLTNQRETVVVWDRSTGLPLHNAIVWQDRRTADTCARLKSDGHEPNVIARTGLPLDPYFSATKIAWILDNVAGARERAERGDLAAGTIDTFLLWRLSGGAVHATDATNASRTALFNIQDGAWDAALLNLFNIPENILPDVRDCADTFGVTDPDLFGGQIAISGVAGDQQAAAIGQACFQPGMLKATFGTGCFMLLNTGKTAVPSQNRLLTTIASRIDGETIYALEGSIYIAGAGIQWLRDGLGLLPRADLADDMAKQADIEQQVVIVPAFVGLGAPYWDSDCRGAIFGLTRNTGANELVKAMLEATCFQTSDLLTAMKKDWDQFEDAILRVDGGMSASDWTMQRLADLLDCPVERPHHLETTALGAAYLAGLKNGFFPPPDEFSKRWKAARRFTGTAMTDDARQVLLTQWKDAVGRTLSQPSQTIS